MRWVNTQVRKRARKLTSAKETWTFQFIKLNSCHPSPFLLFCSPICLFLSLAVSLPHPLSKSHFLSIFFVSFFLHISHFLLFLSICFSITVKETERERKRLMGEQKKRNGEGYQLSNFGNWLVLVSFAVRHISYFISSLCIESPHFFLYFFHFSLLPFLPIPVLLSLYISLPLINDIIALLLNIDITSISIFNSDT